MQKISKKLLLLAFIIGSIYPQSNPDLLPSSVLAFPFGNDSYVKKIYMGKDKMSIWSQKKINAWVQSRGFEVTQDSPEGGFRFRRGAVFHSPGLGFVLTAPISARADWQKFGWKLVLDFGFFHANPEEVENDEVLSNSFRFYQNILRFEVWIDNIYYKTIETGYGISMKSPVIIEIPYLHDDSGTVRVELRMKNHPYNFGILYDAFLSL